MHVNLIIDGNYILSKNTFTLHKNNLLFGALYQSLETSILNYRRLFPFSKVYLVSDTKGKSWRKDIYPEYKMNRKKDSDIDWEFVYNTYGEFKSNVKGVKVLESPGIEGDDFIAYLLKETNLKGQSNIIISNDYDIKQLIDYSLDPSYINIMCNEMWNQQKIFIPKNYQLFLNKLNMEDNDDLFAISETPEFLKLIKGFLDSYQVQEVIPVRTLLSKVIAGDTSDNISSVYETSKNGKVRGIGDKGAESIILSYEDEFGELSLSDPDIWDNLADIIIEKKKASKDEFGNVSKRILENLRLVDLRYDRFPRNIQDQLKQICPF